MADPASWMRRPWSTFSALLGFAMLAVYLSIILSQGSSVTEILPWAALMAAPAILALLSVSTRDRRVARSLLMVAAVLYGIVGVLGILTIGIGFLIAAAAAAVGVARLSG